MEAQPFKGQLGVVKKLLMLQDEGPHAQMVVDELGNEIIAVRSVPTAIYCFLRAQKPIKGIQTENPLRRAIQYAVMNIKHLNDTNYYITFIIGNII